MERKKPRKPKKFRFQVFADWIVAHYAPCRVADIGGGKGLLTYLLNQRGFEGVVIDPVEQGLPSKYTDIHTKRRVRIPGDATVPYREEIFEPEMAKDFDLLIGMHVHGSCIKMLEAAEMFQKNFVLVPCCVIDEPIVKVPDVRWTDSLFELARSKGLPVKEDRLGFVGRARVLYVSH